jgi:proton glutamate symport protein
LSGLVITHKRWIKYIRMKKLELHWQIIIGMLTGILAGYLALQFEHGAEFIRDWIKPFGILFINLLKLIAIPLIIFSLIKGISDLKDITQLSRMGMRTFMLYLFTTTLAITIGIAIVNLIRPGSFMSADTKEQLLAAYSMDATVKVSDAELAKQRGPLQALVDIVPDNFFAAASANGNMLQVIFFVILFGIGLIMVKEETAKPVKDFFDSGNEVILKMIDLVMLSAPFCVFALLAALVAEAPAPDVFAALGAYALTVICGLLILGFLVYPLLLRLFAKMHPIRFLKGIAPAQLVAFSTSSSAATLPVTMERVTEHLGVDEEVSSFVCPVGATINMDGTSLYQAVAAVFIAQVMGHQLTMGDQLTIILTATLASIGSAAVPGAGLLMLVIVLESIGVPAAGIALIFAIDRPLDMCRTVVNVTGDATVATVVAKSLGKLNDPVVKNWDDHYKRRNTD